MIQWMLLVHRQQWGTIELVAVLFLVFAARGELLLFGFCVFNEIMLNFVS
jgi:hypothetical protein